MSEEHLRVMSETAVDMTRRLRTVTDVTARRGMMSLLLTLCRNMEDVAPRNASVAAQERANQLGMGDLRRFHFDDGGRFPGGRKASRLHWEHWRPAADLRRDILALEAPTPEAVAQVLRGSRVCWILLEENERLNSLGFKTNRPDPVVCYGAAGIDLAYEWE